MNLDKVVYVDGTTVINAKNLNDIQDAIIDNTGDISDLESDVSGLDSGKVDKVNGKGLSENDFTDALKAALENIATTDTALSTSGKAADASVTGTAFYGGKTRHNTTTDSDENYLPSFTFWKPEAANYSSVNQFTPAQMPINTCAYVSGAIMDESSGLWFPQLDSDKYYYVFCYKPAYLADGYRLFIVYCATTEETYRGNSTTIGTQNASVTWHQLNTDIDDTLSTSGEAADAKAAGDRFVSDEKIINYTHSYVNYDYDTPFHQVENPSSSSWRKTIGIDRIGMIVTLNSSTGMPYNIRLKLNGAINDDSYATANAFIDAWTNGMTLKTGHKYAVIATLLSGTCAYNESTAYVPAVYVFAAGAHSNLGTATRSEDGHTYTRLFTAEEGFTYNLALYLNSGQYIMSNACVLVVLVDKTESEIELIKETLNTIAPADATLSTVGKAADAKATGDAIATLSAYLPPDTTLAVSGKTADAKATGDAIAALAAYLPPDATLSVDGKAANAKAVGNRFVSDEKVINHAHSLVNYGYDTPFHNVEDPDAPQGEWRRRIGIDRVGMIITLNRQTGMQYSGYMRINGDMNPLTDSIQTASSGIATWTSGVALKTGHQYAAVATLLSGTCNYEDSTTHVPAVWIYAAGESTRLGTETRSEDERTVTRTFTAEEGKTYNLAIRFISGEYICSNACILVRLVDMTESTEYQFDARLTTVEQTLEDLNEDIRETKYQLASGSIRAENGAIITDTTCICTISKEIFPVESGDVLVVDGDYQIVAAHIYISYNMWTSKHVASLTVSDVHRVEIPEEYTGKFLGFAIQKTSMIGEDVSAYIEDAQEHAYVVHEKWLENDLESLNNRISSFESGNVPDYYFIDGYLANKVSAINTIGFEIGRNSLRTVFITDYHMEDNARVSPDLINYVLSYTGVKNIIFGGDSINHAHNYDSMIGGYDKICEFLQDFAPVAEKGNFYPITGNHEYNNADREHASIQIPQASLYNLLNEPLRYKLKTAWADSGRETNVFYFDDDAAKMRIYGVDCDFESVVTADMCGGVIDSLSTVPEGYAVIMFAHHATTRVDDGQGAFLRTDVYSKFKYILQAAAAMNDGTTATITYSGDTTETWNVDFTSCQRTFVGVICGHTHYDGQAIYDGRFPVISTRCDTGAKNRDSASTYRFIGTITEQCFDVVQIDIATKTIYMTRIGYGADRIFHFGATTVSTTAELTSKLSGTLTWTSSNETVATVSGGTVRAVDSGNAYIIATDTDGNFELWNISVS